jgi:RNA polymerase sigma factor (sigma-70 family)
MNHDNGSGVDDRTSLPGTVPTLTPELECQFSALVRGHQQHLYRFILRNIGSSPDAEDIAQEAFVEAYKAMASFRGESKLSTWLYGIAMNLVRNYLNRAPHRVRIFESDEALETLPDHGDGPEALALRSQVLHQLAATVEDLPPDLQQIFLLVAIDGMSYDQAAALLELPIGTVRSRLFRARSTLQERLPDLRGALES